MAAKTRGKAKSPRRTTKKKPSEPLLNQIGAFLFRYEVAGIALILIAALTLLSLITDSRGSVTNAWIRALENLVGVGVWGIPFVCGAVGLWMVIFAFDHLDNLAWERPAGIGLMLVAFITGASVRVSVGKAKASGNWPKVACRRVTPPANLSRFLFGPNILRG